MSLTEKGQFLVNVKTEINLVTHNKSCVKSFVTPDVDMVYIDWNRQWQQFCIVNLYQIIDSWNIRLKTLNFWINANFKDQRLFRKVLLSEAENDTGGQKNLVVESFRILSILYSWVSLTIYQIFRIDSQPTFKCHVGITALWRPKWVFFPSLL